MTKTELYAREALAVALYESACRSRCATWSVPQWLGLSTEERGCWRDKLDNIIATDEIEATTTTGQFKSGGDFLVYLGTDAEKWAKAFIEYRPACDIDQDDARAWFANAIMAGYDSATTRGETVDSEYVTTPENAESIAERYSDCCETAKDCDCK